MVAPSTPLIPGTICCDMHLLCVVCHSLHPVFSLPMSFMVQCCPLLCLKYKDNHWLLAWAGEISSLCWAAAAPGLSAESCLTSEMLMGVGLVQSSPGPLWSIKSK